jgi:excinuclease UvrABC ATPase subunit
MPQAYIEIRDAHESKLKHVSLRIPKRTITHVTGRYVRLEEILHVFDSVASEARCLANGCIADPRLFRQPQATRSLS